MNQHESNSEIEFSIVDGGLFDRGLNRTHDCRLHDGWLDKPN